MVQSTGLVETDGPTNRRSKNYKTSPKKTDKKSSNVKIEQQNPTKSSELLLKTEVHDSLVQEIHKKDCSLTSKETVASELQSEEENLKENNGSDISPQTKVNS